jgi:hypothetical protein
MARLTCELDGSAPHQASVEVRMLEALPNKALQRTALRAAAERHDVRQTGARCGSVEL